MFARHISQSQLRGAAIRIALLASPISYIFMYTCQHTAWGPQRMMNERVDALGRMTRDAAVPP